LFRALRLIPVDRERNPEKALSAARTALQQGDVIAIFPQGGIYPPNLPPPVNRGTAFLASLVAAPIAPLRLEGVRGEGHTVLAVLMPSPDISPRRTLYSEQRLKFNSLGGDLGFGGKHSLS